MNNLPIVDEAIVRTLHVEAGKGGNNDKHTQIFCLASIRAENVEQFDPAMVKAFFDMAKWCMYERQFRRAAVLMEKAWPNLLSMFPDNRTMHLEALSVLKQSYIKLDESGSMIDALKAALSIMQECVNSRDGFTMRNPRFNPARFSDDAIAYLKQIKHKETIDLIRRVNDLNGIWGRVLSTIEPVYD